MSERNAAYIPCCIQWLHGETRPFGGVEKSCLLWEVLQKLRELGG